MARVYSRVPKHRFSSASHTSTGLLGGGLMGGGALRNLMAVGAGYIGVTKGIGGTVGAAIKFEEAFADVRKVVNGTPAELSKIRHEILSMSKTLPVTAEGISAIYAAAGQSNIPINELGKFSEMVAKVSVAWEVSESETSDALAKIKNQLNMNVDQIGLYADAINELGNNTAAKAPDLVDFSKRVAAQGDMFGFSTTQTLAFGGAMIAAGGQTNVAATSFRNMGNALTVGAGASKKVSGAFSRLGLDAIKTSKKMQKDAVGTTLDTLDRIQKLPEWERITVARALFGDEARALMPVIANSTELRRQLTMVATEASYAGSAFEEYMVRADTSANALQILGNKMRGVGIGIGDSWLPTIKQFSLGIGDVLDTLDKRVGVLDKIQMSFSGFMSGVGYGGTGGVREMMNDFGDLFFGDAFKGDGNAVDQRMVDLAKMSNTFRHIGEDVRSFVDNVGGGNVGAAIGDLGSAITKLSGGMTVTGALAIGLVGRGLMGIAAGAVALALSPIGRIAIVATAVADLINAAKGANSLGEFAANMSEFSAIQWVVLGAGVGLVALRVGRLAAAAGRLAKNLGLIKNAGGVGGALAGGKLKPPIAAKPNSVRTGKPSPWGDAPKDTRSRSLSRPTGPHGGKPTPVGSTPWAFKWSNLGKGVAGGAFTYFATAFGEAMISAGLEQVNSRILTPEQREKAETIRNEPWLGSGLKSLWDMLPTDLTKPVGGVKTTEPTDVSLIGTPPVSVMTPVETYFRGTQDVRVTNPAPAPIVNVTVYAQTNADPSAIASATAKELNRQLALLSGGTFSDGVA